MTWLYSLYWLAAITAAGPVLFHMWRRIPRGERPFSTLMFLTPSPPRLTSRSRIEHWALLLLRVAALLLIVVAFTRPLWRIPVVQPDELSQEKLLAVLVDTSASMRRQGLWDGLVEQLDQRLASLPAEVTVALYRFDHQLSSVVDFRELKAIEPSARRALVRTRLRELKPGWQDTQLGEALIQTAAALQDEQAGRSKPVQQRILLCSDLQAGAEIVPLQGYEWPDEILVEFLPMKPISPSNAGLQAIERHAESLDDALRVRITNSPDSLKQQFTLRWDLPDSPTLSVYVPPGQSRVVTPPNLPGGAAATSLILEGDDHDFDNRIFVTETLTDKRLVVYCGHDSTDDPEGSRFFLERVFKASRQFQIEIQEPRDANLAAADQQPALIILINPEQEFQSFVRNFLERGGTILIASPTAEEMNACLTLCGSDGIQVSEATIPQYAMLAEIDFEHPLFAPFVESQFSNFTGIRFWKHRSIHGTGDASLPQTAPTARVLARFDDSEPAVVEIPSLKGNLILFAAGWRPADSQFARSSKFPMLMFRLLEQASGTTSHHGSQSVGEPLAWPTTRGQESISTGTVRLPDGKEIRPWPANEPFTKTDSPGIYALSIPGRTEQFAINLAPDESQTAPMTLEKLESHGLKLHPRPQPELAQLQIEHKHQLQLIELEQSQKLWQKVLLAAILCLLVESFLSGHFEKNKGVRTH